MGEATYEIERVWLLIAVPEIPAGAERWTIEQGYLDAASGVEGRVRSITYPDGRREFVHTIKSGEGLVREESERAITGEEFDRLWPSTLGRRIRKVRHRVREGALVWEVDEFLDWPLAMAEVELPDTSTEVTPPGWLRGVMGREVTNDPRYRNSALAFRGLPPVGS
jgi:CYTH domain-containing protein